MPNLIYLHGFLSSPQSYKAQQTLQWFKQHQPQWRVYCPSLSSYPDDAMAQLSHVTDTLSSMETYAIGSSLGGFWATWLLQQKCVAKAVVVNPAVAPHTRFDEFINKPIKSYYGDEYYVLTEAHLATLKTASVPFTQPQNLWLLAQKGDETLDYRQARDYYAGARQTIEEGGNHSFEHFQRYFSPIVSFFESSD